MARRVAASSQRMSSNTIVTGVGLGVTFGALEAWRYPVFGHTSSSGIALLDANVVAILALLACCAYLVFVRRRMARGVGVVFAVAALSTVSFFCYSTAVLDLHESLFTRFVMSFHMALLVLLFVLWMEELLRMPDEEARRVMAVGLLSTFAIQALVTLLDRSMAWGVCSLLPLFSATFFLLHRYMLQSQFGFLGVERARGGGDHPLELRRLGELAPALLAIFLCGLVFNLLNRAWRSSDLALTDATAIQLFSALGALVAGLVLLLQPKSVPHGYVEILIAGFTLLALLLTNVATVPPTLYLTPLNVAQKLMFALFLLLAQRFEDRPLRTLAFCVLFCTYRLGLYALSNLVALLTGALAWDPELVEGGITVLGACAMLAFAAYELSAMRARGGDGAGTVEPAASEVAGERALMERYRNMAFSYYLTQHLDLTQREARVASLLVEGLSSQAIADELVISQSTVKTHMHNVYGKAGVHSQGEFAAYVEAERAAFFAPDGA